MNRRLLTSVLCVAIAAGAVAGCGARASSERPLVRDDRGAVVSQLIFPEAQRTVVLPLSSDGVLLCAQDVRINGRHVGAFIIDTGAGITTLDRSAARKLGLTPDKRWRKLTDRLPAADGFYRIDAVEIGNGDALAVRNHVIAVLDLSSVRRRPGRPEIAGVIGADIWAMLPFTVDYARREVVFHARDSFRPPPAERGVESPLLVRAALNTPAPFADANPLAGAPSVPAAINGDVVDAVLDTASGSSVLLMPQLIAKRPQWVRGDRPVARAAGAGGVAGLAGYHLFGAEVQTVDALGVRFTDIRSALAIIDPLPRGPAAAVLGVRLLSKLRLTFDYAAGKVWAEVK